MATFSSALSSHFSWWRTALSGPIGPVHDNDPQPGYYRTKRRGGGKAQPVAIWHDGERLRAIRDGIDVDPSTIWTWCCMHPIPYETYVAVAERGEPWPEDVPEIGASGVSRRVPTIAAEEPASGQRRDAERVVAEDPETPDVVGVRDHASAIAAAIEADHGTGHGTNGLVGIGHNSAGAGDEPVGRVEELRCTISALWHNASDWMTLIGTISTQVEADRAANFAERFGALERVAEDERTSEKRPILEQGRAIDAKWKPTIGAADDAKRAMKKVLEPYLIAQTQRIRDEVGYGELVESVKAGTNGRKVSLRRVRRIHIRDSNAFIAHYRRDARLFADEAVQKVLLKLAEADLAAGKRVPGTEIIEEQVAA
jgi:hypothetical protein